MGSEACPTLGNIGGKRLLASLSQPNAEVSDEIAKITWDSSDRILEIGYKWSQTGSPLARPVIRRTGLSRFARVKALEDVSKHGRPRNEPSLVRPPMTSGFW